MVTATKLRRMIYGFFVAIFALTVVFARPVLALTDAQRLQFSRNNILFYDPDENGCATVSSSHGGGKSDGSDVYLIGDSITNPYSLNAIRNALPDVTINARAGIYFSHNIDNGENRSGVARISEIGNQDILVFAVGTNGGIDYVYHDDTEKFFSAMSGRDVKVILMTVYYYGMSPNGDNEMTITNRKVKELANTYANITYFDWYSVAASDPEKYIALSEGMDYPVHPTAEGSSKFAELILAAVNDVTSMNSASSSKASSSGLVESQIEFVNKYHDIAVSLSTDYGIPWETVMAQGILESASGTSFFATDRNNFFGIGAFDSNPDNAFHYDTPEDGWRGYYENIRVTSTYRNHGVFSGSTITDPYEYLATIKEAGYATAVNYVEAVGAVIRGIEAYMAERGWPSSAQIAAANPAWFENAAKNAEGGQPANTVKNSNGSYDYCNKVSDYKTTSGGVSYGTYDGYSIAFPLAGATKETVRGYVSTLPCEGATYGCHYGHDNPSGPAAAAWDLCFNGSSSTPCDNATVVSITDGEIIGVSYERTHNGETAPCNHVRIRNSIDNTVIAYMHLAYEPEIVAGTQVKAGDVIGHVSPGVSACNDHSVPHVHIDKASDPALTGGPYDFQRDSEIVAMVNAGYYALPENEAELALKETAAASGDGVKPITPLSVSSESIACDSHTVDLGVYENAHISGNKISIRKCSIPNIIQAGSETGYAIVNSRVSGAFYALAARYKEQTGNTLSAESSLRTYEQQTILYNCYIEKNCNNGNLAAVPGTSNHEGGLAIDFSMGSGGWDSAVSKFFYDNLNDFGLNRTVSSEPWHVSPGG
ncbi:glucosaminidase domain-containing protein [Candidatus Saccharibacteria bacterium]|nr:glucosaminidase domain-containing protein [Candidatus Saccharibacteria bacterium]